MEVKALFPLMNPHFKVLNSGEIIFSPAPPASRLLLHKPKAIRIFRSNNSLLPPLPSLIGFE